MTDENNKSWTSFKEWMLQIVTITLSVISIFGPLINEFFQRKLEKLAEVSSFLEFDFDAVSNIIVKVSVPAQATRSIHEAQLRLRSQEDGLIKRISMVGQTDTPMSMKRSDQSALLVAIGTIHPGDHKVFVVELERPLSLSAMKFQAEILAENEPLVSNDMQLGSKTQTSASNFLPWLVPIAYMAGLALIILLLSKQFVMQRNFRGSQMRVLELEKQLDFYRKKFE